jgi:uncharacterized membrane protein
LAPKYRQAGKKKKGEMLYPFVELTGYTCKYVIFLLQNWGRRRVVKIDGELVPLLRTMLPVLENFGEIELEESTRTNLQRISAATIGRLEFFIVFVAVGSLVRGLGEVHKARR